MENNIPLLSICIPTYNRSQYLSVSLEAIIEQANEFPGKIEIIVSDNASTDTTQSVVESFIERFSLIKYFRNSENLGYDRNLDNAIRRANGKFCWFLSDDERVLPGTLKVLIDLLEANQDIAYLCIDIRGNSIRKMPSERTIHVKNGVQLLEEYGIVGGLISQNIIARRFFPKNTERYFGNLWIHLSIIFEIILDRPLILLDQVLIEGQRDVCTWAKGGKALFTFTSLKNIIISWGTIGYPKSIITLLLREFVPSLPKILISAKVQGLPTNRENFRFLFREYRQFPLYLTGGILVYIVPTVFFRTLVKFLGK